MRGEKGSEMSDNAWDVSEKRGRKCRTTHRRQLKKGMPDVGQSKGKDAGDTSDIAGKCGKSAWNMQGCMKKGEVVPVC